MITIRTEKESITLKLTEEESQKTFWEIVSILKEGKSLGGGITHQEAAEATQDEPKGQQEDEGYPRFLHIKCPECGETVSYCAKKPTREHICRSCGKRIELKELVYLNVDCECGRHSLYRTNRLEKEFDIECINCGNPVAVEWNEKKKLYQTIKGAI